MTIRTHELGSGGAGFALASIVVRHDAHDGDEGRNKIGFTDPDLPVEGYNQLLCPRSHEHDRTEGRVNTY
jgi:hypothetical protein